MSTPTPFESYIPDHLYSGHGMRDEVRGLIQLSFKLYGIHPLCRGCPNAENCKMPNVPGLRLTCIKREKKH